LDFPSIEDQEVDIPHKSCTDRKTKSIIGWRSWIILAALILFGLLKRRNGKKKKINKTKSKLIRLE
jgi:hypothetical protein